MSGHQVTEDRDQEGKRAGCKRSYDPKSEHAYEGDLASGRSDPARLPTIIGISRGRNGGMEGFGGLDPLHHPLSDLVDVVNPRYLTLIVHYNYGGVCKAAPPAPVIDVLAGHWKGIEVLDPGP